VIERLWKLGGWIGVAFTLALSLGPPTLGEGASEIDKLAHLLGYALLMFWWAQLVVHKRWKLAVAVVLFGVAIELLQGLTPERQPDPLDALANAAGALLGWLAARLLPNLPARIATLSALRR
jgi:VanZ family protein